MNEPLPQNFWEESASEEESLPGAPRLGCLRRILFVLLVMLLLAVALHTAVDQYLMGQINKLRQEYLSVEVLPEPIAPEDNGVTYLAGLEQQLDHCLAEAQLPRTPAQILQPLLQDTWNGVAPELSPADAQALEKTLEACHEVRAQITQALEAPEFMLSPYLEEQPVPGRIGRTGVALQQELNALEAASAILLGTALTFAERGDEEEVCSTLDQLHTLLAGLSGQPLLLEQSLRFNMMKDTLIVLRLLAEKRALSAACRETWIVRLGDWRDPQSFMKQLEAELRTFLSALETMIESGWPRSWPALKRRVRRPLSLLQSIYFLQDYDRKIRHVKSAPLHIVDEAGDEEEWRQLWGIGPWVGPLAPPISAFTRVADLCALVQTALLLQAYHERHGTFPDTLEALPPLLPENVPRASELYYEKTATGYLLRLTSPSGLDGDSPVIMWEN